MSSPRNILQEYWGYDAFRPLQEDIISSVLSGKDTMAMLPTGGGKSVCYQVPALAQEGICIVVSPLIALMKDQVEQLKKRGILAAAIYSGQSYRQIVQIMKNVAGGSYKLLYVSPERLETPVFKEYLPALRVNLVAIDEAHCVSQWGYDFRPAYLRIAALREELPGVPFLALTASATPGVQADIQTQLKLLEPAIFRQPYARPNLSYSTFLADSKQDKLVDIVGKVTGSAIVYCSSRRRTVEVAELLQLHGHAASFYHAGLHTDLRAERQQDWISNKTRIMVCTNAFGMGIDKPDVRLVVHADLPDSLEAYYQEAGRAGRDGKRAYAVLLYNDRDINKLEALHTLRFPGLETIRAVYSALVNYLQMPTYTGDGMTFTFRLEDCVKKFNLDPQTALPSLKAIEGDGWIDFNEKSFRPSTVVFTANRSSIQEFYEGHPELEDLLTTLLRTYGGIWDFPVFISEKVLAGLLYTDATIITKHLKDAQAFGILEYTPLEDNPQVVFLKHRVDVSEFRINMAAYEERKEAFIARAKKMIGFVHTEACRGVFINQYFGDLDEAGCGICDNCLAKKRAPLSAEAMIQLQDQIRLLVSGSPVTAPELLSRLQGFSKEHAWKALDHLQSEQQVRVDEQGRIHCA